MALESRNNNSLGSIDFPSESENISDLRKIDRIFRLNFELLGNISKRWENFTNRCRNFFPWKVEIIPQKRKFVYFSWIFFHLNYEIYLSFLINWIFLRPNSRNYFGKISGKFFIVYFQTFRLWSESSSVIFISKILKHWIKLILLFLHRVRFFLFSH